MLKHDFRRNFDCLIRIDKKEGEIIFVPEFGFSISAFSTWKNFLKHVWQPQKIIYESIISWPDICKRVKGFTDRNTAKNNLGPTRTRTKQILEFLDYFGPISLQIWRSVKPKTGPGSGLMKFGKSRAKSDENMHGRWIDGPLIPGGNDICTVQEWNRWWNLSDIYKSHSDYCFRVRILMSANRS